jgi:hypothetical protein
MIGRLSLPEEKLFEIFGELLRSPCCLIKRAFIMGLCKQVRSAFGKCAHTKYLPAMHSSILMSMVAWPVPTRPVWEGKPVQITGARLYYVCFYFSIALWDQAQVTLHWQSFWLSAHTLSWYTVVRWGGGGVTNFSRGPATPHTDPTVDLLRLHTFRFLKRNHFDKMCLWISSFDSFHLPGYVTSQNQRYGMSENPRLFQEI